MHRNESHQRPTDRCPWPTERGSYSGILVQFGQARAGLLRDALITGDPLADAVVEEIHADGRAIRAQLGDGVRDGLASVADPYPAVIALLTSTETLPSYATDWVLDEAPLPFFSMLAAAHIVSLSAGAIIRVYQSPSIAKVLTTTGRLVDGADRRIRETGKWMSTVMLPGSLAQGRRVTSPPSRCACSTPTCAISPVPAGSMRAPFGAPINQVDLARTWMDFTVTSISAEEKMGPGLTMRETADMYRYWWVEAHLLGVDTRLVEGISTNEEARRVDDLFQAVTGPLIAEASALATATLNSIADLLYEAINVPTSLGSAGLYNLARRFHPCQISDELGIAENAMVGKTLELAISRIRAHRAGLPRQTRHAPTLMRIGERS